jgi:MIP family channel proteins
VPIDWLRRASAEFVGTFALIFIGVGAGLFSGGQLLPVAFAHGLVIAVMASAVGHISGGHFNPAVTFGFVVTRRMELPLAAVYWFTQLLAATIAALALRFIFPSQANLDGGVPQVNEAIDLGPAVLTEAILTFFLVWVVFATAADPRGTFKAIAGLAIGLTITMDVLMGGPLTGAAMNPARALGPELLSNDWDNFWIWYVGPFAGAVIAAVAYELLYLRPVRPAVVGPPETGVEQPRPGDTALS